MFLLKLLFIALALSSSISIAEGEKYVNIGAQTIKIDGKDILAVTFENTKGWHTYWKNPGDAGLPTRLSFKVDGSPIVLESYPWPAPKRFIEQGDMWAFGYSGKYAYFFDLQDLVRNKQLSIKGNWLVCKDICIPGSKTIQIDIDDQLSGNNNDILSEKKLNSIFTNLPENSLKGIELYLTKGDKENQLALHYIIENVDFTKISKSSSIITPYIQEPFDYKHEEIYLDKKAKILFGRIYIDWDGLFEEPAWELPKDGIFKKSINAKFLLQYPTGSKPQYFTKEFKEFTLTGDAELSKRFKALKSVSNEKSKLTQEPNSLFYYILFAFLGGIILNFMPCVLPVISLKLFGLIVHSNESKKQILKHNLAYTAGVLFSFALLALSIVILKSSGDQIGWGFQLQSPLFVFFMCSIIYVMALNMLGLFEFSTPGGKHLGNTEIKKGIYADFVNGILATILSTPCSAPFLGTALTFAFTTSSMNIFIILLSVGTGLAFPFILTGFAPSLIKFLPRPGVWMDKLKKVLGLSLILTSVWLIDVFFSIIDYSVAGIYFNTFLALLFFAFYFRKSISKSFILNILIFSLPLLFAFKVIQLASLKSSQTTESPRRQEDAQWKSWSQEKMNKPENLRFFHFTASWCLTCKVNKKIVLDSDDFRQLAEKYKLELLVGDWTKRNDDITLFLKKFNIVGVPAYFVQKEDGRIISLGETISLSKIEEALK